MQLQHHIDQEVDSDSISQDDHNKLLKLVDKKYTAMVKALPATLASMTLQDSDDIDQIHAAETKKLTHLHELSAAMAEGNRSEVLNKNAKKLQNAALQVFVEGTNTLAPHESDLNETVRRHDLVAETIQDYLSPMLELISQDPDKALSKALKSTSATTADMRSQLESIPKEIKAKQDLLGKLQGFQQEVDSLTQEARTLTKQLDRTKGDYQELRAKAGASKFRRRFNIPYQINRLRNRQQQRKITTEQTATADKIRDKFSDITQGQRDYSHHQMKLSKLRTQFKTSLKAVKSNFTDPINAVKGSTYAETFQLLSKARLVQEVDVITVQKFFDEAALAEAEPPGTVLPPIKELTKEFKTLVMDKKYSPQQALWIINNTLAERKATEFEPGCCQPAIDFLWKNAGLNPERASPPIPFYLEKFAEELSEANPGDIGAKKNSEIVASVHKLVGEHPELKNDIDDLCHFMVDGFYDDSEWVDESEEKGLFNDYVTAFQTGVRELTVNKGTIDTAFGAMQKYLDIREAELRS